MSSSNSRVALCLCALLWVTGAMAGTDPVRDAIEANNRAFIGAVLRGDAQGVASLYTINAQVVAPGSEVAKGRVAIAAMWQASINAGIRGLSLVTSDVDSSGDLASETGTVQIVAGDGTITNARYVVVWKQEGGAWRLHRDIWNAGP